MHAIGWALWKYNLTGYLFWGVNRWSDDPWKVRPKYKEELPDLRIKHDDLLRNITR